MKGEWSIASEGARMQDGELCCKGRLKVDGMFLSDVTFVASGKNLRAPLFPGNCLFSGLLLLAMSEKYDLHSELPLSPGFIGSANEISRIIDAWHPEASAVGLSCDQGSLHQGKSEKAAGVGCFFSGGVDSFYSLMRHKDVITHLIFIHGFDVPLHKEKSRKVSLSGVYRVAEALGMEVIEVSTDIRYFGDQLAWWGFYGIPVLVASAHLLSGVLGKIYLPATLDYAQLKPDVTHPYVDPMWSTNELEIVHDGACADRAQKCEAIAHWDLALEHLRVCWELEGELNCGGCEKCIRTQISFDVLGRLDKCSSFSGDYEPERIKEYAYESWRFCYLGDTLRLARKHEHGAMIKILEEAYLLIRAPKTAEDLHANMPAMGSTSSWEAISRSIRQDLFAYLRQSHPEWMIKKMHRYLPQVRESLFRIFWQRCRRWLFRRVLARRLGFLKPG
ncbi:MAG: hypothetical protein GY899_00465 [Verrucomicrobiaceae bacterium]|nr:hypothetical protein [Verrucomicrobiaceae bacterium]